MIIVFLFLSIGNTAYSQARITGNTAIEAFEKEDYGNAYRQFGELIDAFPKDPVYKYYMGATLVNLDADPNVSSRLLSEAQQSVSLSRPLPAESFLWLGRANQQLARFAEAIEAYNEFTGLAGRRLARELGVLNYIEECENGEGAIDSWVTLSELDDLYINPTIARIMELDSDQGTDTNRDVYGESSSSDEGEALLQEEPSFLPEPFDEVLAEAVTLQMKTDSLALLIDNQRKEYETLGSNERVEMKRTIDHNTGLTDSLQNVADDKFEEARLLINGTDFSEEIETDKEITDIDLNEEYGSYIAESVHVMPGVTSLFKIDNSLINSREDITVNPELPQGLIYRIQIAILRNPATQSTFKGLSPVYGIRDDGATSTKYYVGLFRKRVDAEAALNVVHSTGFRDAFIISLLSGTAISGERATSLEKEWEDIPFAYTETGVEDVKVDTVPPVLSYRVELLRTKQPVSGNTLVNIKKISETRGLDIVTLDDGVIVYLVGKFVTLDSAEDYANLVSRNGYPEAKVSAWLGYNEIPMEMAGQLFDMI